MEEITIAIAWILIALFIVLIVFINSAEPGQFTIWHKAIQLVSHWIDIELQR